MKNIAIFASGNGTNAQAIIDYFKNKAVGRVKVVVSNNPKAFVLERAKKANIPTLLINRTDFYESDKVINELKKQQIDVVVLAGFLWKVPDNLIKAFANKIVNIHPALLPKYGGKGMYGMNVHQAVKIANDTETGITIHFLNEHYDEGEIIFQAKVPVSLNDTPQTIAEKVNALEYEHYPGVINKLLEG